MGVSTRGKRQEYLSVLFWLLTSGFWLFVDVLAGSPVDSTGQNGCRPPSAVREFGVGERFIYSIELGPLNAGVSQTEIAGITQIDGHSCYHIVSQTTTNKAFSVLYKVDDYIESFVD